MKGVRVSDGESSRSLHSPGSVIPESAKKLAPCLLHHDMIKLEMGNLCHDESKQNKQNPIPHPQTTAPGQASLASASGKLCPHLLGPTPPLAHPPFLCIFVPRSMRSSCIPDFSLCCQSPE